MEGPLVIVVYLRQEFQAYCCVDRYVSTYSKPNEGRQDKYTVIGRWGCQAEAKGGGYQNGEVEGVLTA